MLKTLFLIPLLLGLVMGPGYWIYAKLFSGKQAQTLNPSVTLDGRIVSTTFRLDPGMKPVGMVFHAMGSFSPNMDDDKPPKDGYSAILYRNGATLLNANLTLAASAAQLSNPVFKERLFWLEGAESGEYHLEIVPVKEPQIKLDHLRLEVRSNMLEPDGRVVSAGLVLAIIGFLGWFLG